MDEPVGIGCTHDLVDLIRSLSAYCMRLHYLTYDLRLRTCSRGGSTCFAFWHYLVPVLVLVLCIVLVLPVQ
jgi:hypothetical protein